MAVQVPIEFIGRFEQLLNNFDKATRQIQRRTDDAAGSLKFLQTGFAAIASAFTVNKIIDGLQTITKAASEAEESQFRLVNALAATGDATQVNIQLFENLATELARTTRFDDDVIRGQIAVAKQFNLTNKEASRLIRVAADLAAATGEDLPTAVRLLGQTLDGTAGKLANQFPILRGLTAEQLRNGAAVELLGKQYEGAAARSLGTFAGRTAQVGKAFDDVLKAAGRVITQNPDVLRGLAATADGFVALANTITENAAALSRWLSRFIQIGTISAKASLALVTKDYVALYEAFEQGIEVLDDQEKALNNNIKGFENLAQRFNPITGKYEEFVKVAKDVNQQAGVFNFVTGRIQSDFDELGKTGRRSGEDIRKEYEALAGTLRDIGGTGAQTITNAFLRQQNIINQARQQGIINQVTAEDQLAKLRLKYEKDIAEERKKQFQEQQQLFQETFQNPARFLFSQDQLNRPGGAFGLGNEGQRAAGAGFGLINNVLGGKEGARNLLSGAASAAGTALFGPAGAALGDLVKILSQGPDEVRAQITAFADSLPDLIVAIAEAIPVALETIGDKLPEIIERLVEKSPQIIAALIRSLPAFQVALIKATIRAIAEFGKGAVEFVKKIIEGAGRFIGELIKGAGRFIEELVRGAGRFVQELIKKITGPIGGGGKGGPLAILGGGSAGAGSLLGGGIPGLPGLGGKGFDLGSNLGGITSRIIPGGGGGGGSLLDSIVSAPARAIRSIFGKGGAAVTDSGVLREIGGGSVSPAPGGGGQPMVVSVQIGQKQLAQAIVDLQRNGFSIA